MRLQFARFVLVAVLLGSIGSACAGKDPFGSLTVDEVAAKIGQKNVYIYDNNSEERYAQGHVPGAKWLDDSAVTEAALPADKAATLIFYCSSEH